MIKQTTFYMRHYKENIKKKTLKREYLKENKTEIMENRLVGFINRY